MNNYGNMGMPDGEGSMGMGSQAPTGKLKDAFKIQQLKTNHMLRRRSQAEEEEPGMGGQDDMSAMAGADSMGDQDDYAGGEEGGMNDQMGMDDGMGSEDDVAALQQFFTDTPEPSDQEISQYAQENGMDMQGMRSAVYALIKSLIQSSGATAAGEEFDWLGSDDEKFGGDESDPEGMGDEEYGMDDGSEGGTDELNFSVPGDTGERPAKKEFEERKFGRRSSDRR